MGAEVTVCGPPTLIPREIEQLGCEVSYSLDRLGEADVVYALRLQEERMAESFVPSIREYAAHFQIDSRRLGPRQLLMHPGPVNRGVELSGEVIDSPQSLIDRAGRLRPGGADGDPLRAARIRPRAPGRRGRRGRREPDSDRTAGVSLAEALDMRSGEGADLVLRGATVLDPVAGHRRRPRRRHPRRPDRRARPPPAAELDGLEEVDAEGLHAFPAFFDPHVHLRTPGQEHKEDIETGSRAAAAGGYCGILAMANTDPPVSTPADVEALREARARGGLRPGRLPRHGDPRHGGRGADRDGVDLREAGAVGFSDDGLPIRDARVLRRALQYQRLCGGTIALHEEDPDALRRRRHARGRRSPPRSAWPASRRSRSRR